MNLFEFIKHPYIPEKQEKFRLKEFFKLFGLVYLISFPFGVATQVLIKGGVIPPSEINSIFKNLSPYLAFLIIVMLAPIAEESIFRLNLIPKRRNLWISIFVVIAYVTFNLFFAIRDNHFKIVILCILFLIFLAVFYLEVLLKTNYKNYFVFVFYFSSILFGLVHVFNFGEPAIKTFLFAVIITMPQIIVGFVCGYLRMNYGFKYGVAFHMMVNLVAFTFMFLAK
jgi:membrane protease YdiL (CAAX protease family)